MSDILQDTAAGDPGLISITQAIDAPAADPAAAGAPGQPAAAPKDWGSEAAQLIEFFSELFTPLYPSLAKVYTPEARARLAAAAGPLLAKYNFDMAAMFGRFGPEIGFAIVAVPLVMPTLQAIKHDRAQLDKPKDAPPPTPPPAELNDKLGPPLPPDNGLSTLA